MHPCQFTLQPWLWPLLTTWPHSPRDSTVFRENPPPSNQLLLRLPLNTFSYLAGERERTRTSHSLANFYLDEWKRISRSCAASLNAPRPTTRHFITAEPHGHLTHTHKKKVIYLFFFQITVLVTLPQPLVIVCFSLVLDRGYFEECPLCSLYLSQKSAHVGCARKRRESGLCAPAAYLWTA